jgi:hypothetical protein
MSPARTVAQISPYALRQRRRQFDHQNDATDERVVFSP